MEVRFNVLDPQLPQCLDPSRQQTLDVGAFFGDKLVLGCVCVANNQVGHIGSKIVFVDGAHLCCHGSEFGLPRRLEDISIGLSIIYKVVVFEMGRTALTRFSGDIEVQQSTTPSRGAWPVSVDGDQPFFLMSSLVGHHTGHWVGRHTAALTSSFDTNNPIPILKYMRSLQAQEARAHMYFIAFARDVPYP